MTIEEAFALVDSIHNLIVLESDHSVNYLRLECLGVNDHQNVGTWAASFDSSTDTDPEWFELHRIGSYPFAARAFTPEEAIRLAGEKLVARHPEFKGGLADFELNL